jgi:triacylglycerol lipase
VSATDALDVRLSRALKLVIALEFGAYAALIALSPGARFNVLLACVAFALLWRSVMFLGSVPAAWWFGDRRGSLADWLRAIGVEWWAMLRAYSVDQVMVSGPIERAGSGAPVLLVHGFFCNAGIFRQMMDALPGRPLRAVNLDPLFWLISSGGPRLSEQIRAWSAANGGQPVTLIAHSMGGVYARYVLGRHHDLPVAGLITLGSPHAGTQLARLLPGGSERGPVRPRSAWLSDSNLTKIAEGCRLLAVLSWQDNIIVPQRSAFVPDAPEAEFSGVGHVALLYDRRVHALLNQTLEEWHR